MAFEASPADAVEFIDGGVESDGADDAGGAGFFAFERVGPHDVVEVDEVRRRLHRQGRGRRRRRHGAGRSGLAGAERRVDLVAAPRHVIDRTWETSVRCELGGVDEDGDATCVGGRGDVIDGRHPPGDVRRAGDGQQLRLWFDVSASSTSSTVKVPSGPHSTNRRRARRAQGNKLAWCSMTVVTTTSSGSRRSRQARWLQASVVLRQMMATSPTPAGRPANRRMAARACS